MRVTITDKNKKDIFVSIFQTIKNTSTLVNLLFSKDKLHMQGCDISHVYLFDIDISRSWFTTYEVDKHYNICLNTALFFKVLSTKNEHDIILHLNQNSADVFYVDLVNSTEKGNKSDFNKFFEIPLNEIINYEELLIPDNDYNADFTITAKKLVDIVSQMSSFSEDVSDISIIVDGDTITLATESIAGGTFTAKIDSDSIIEYAILEDYTINLKYSIQYVKSCLTNKLSNNIKLSITDSFPMKIYYDLGENSNFVFYIANKTDD